MNFRTSAEFFLQDWQFFHAVLPVAAHASDQQGKPPLPSKALKALLGEMLSGRDLKGGAASCRYVLVVVDGFTFR